MSFQPTPNSLSEAERLAVALLNIPTAGAVLTASYRDVFVQAATLLRQSVFSEKGDSAEAERAMIAGYRAGMKDGITDYAVWNNGGQYVGVLRKPLKQVLAQVNEIPDNIVLQSALRNING